MVPPNTKIRPEMPTRDYIAHWARAYNSWFSLACHSWTRLAVKKISSHGKYRLGCYLLRASLNGLFFRYPFRFVPIETEKEKYAKEMTAKFLTCETERLKDRLSSDLAPRP
jgi:hypothetical protein